MATLDATLRSGPLSYPKAGLCPFVLSQFTLSEAEGKDMSGTFPPLVWFDRLTTSGEL